MHYLDCPDSGSKSALLNKGTEMEEYSIPNLKLAAVELEVIKTDADFATLFNAEGSDRVLTLHAMADRAEELGRMVLARLYRVSATL